MKKYILTSLILLLAGVNSAWGQNVAKIVETGTEYATLADAVAAVQSNETITLLSNTTVASMGNIEEKTGVVIDLNGKTINLTANEIHVNKGSEVTIKNGTIDITGNNATGDCIFGVGHYNNTSNTLTLDNITLQGDGYSSAYCVLYAYGDGANTLNVNNSTINLKNDASPSGGILKGVSSTGGTINVNNSKITGDNVQRGFTNGIVNITNHSEITITNSDNGINSSVLTIEDSKVTITGGSGRGITATSSAPVVIKGASTINLSGNTEGDLLLRNGNATVTVGGTSTLTAGTISQSGTNNTLMVAPTATVTATTSSVTQSTPVAEIVTTEGTSYYSTLEAAIAAATDGQTITLLTNVELDEPVEIDKSITLDLDGKTISISATYPYLYAISVSSGTVTITGNGTIDAGKVLSNGGNLTINDGTFTAYDEEVLMALTGTITVNGGSFTVTKSAEAAWPFVAYANAGLIQISGGTFTGGEDSNLGADDTEGGTIKVSGGQFSEQVLPEYCASGYVPVTTPDTNGMYTVQVNPTMAVASITNANNETTNYLTLEAAISAATAGQAITLLKNITLTNTVAINKGITIDGDNHTVTKASGVAFELTGSNDVTFTNLKIDATGNDGRAIQAGNSTVKYSGNLTVSNSTLTAGQRGVSIFEPGGNINLAISNTTIQSAVADPTTTYVNSDTRGVALWSYVGHSHNVTLDNTIIKGFSYCINVGGTGKINDLTMTGGSTYGRAAINNHGKNGTFNLTNVEIHGLNNQTGPTEAFACIMDDTDAANNTYNLDNCTIIATLSDAAISAGGNASEYLVDLRGKDSNIFITNGTTYTSNCEERGGLIEYYDRLGTQMGNTINFDAATYATFDAVYDFANVDGLNTTGNTLTYISEVYYYWTGQNAGGEYCSFTDPFTKNWLADGEFIQLQRDVTLTSDITCQLVDGNSFYLELNGHSISRDANAQVPTYIYLNEGVTVYTDVEIDGFLLGLNGCPIVKSANTDATYKYKYTVVGDDYVAHINGTLYESLAAAVAAAQAGDVIELIADDDVSLVDPGSEIIISKPITITGPVDENGLPLFTIWGSSNGALNNDNFNDLFVKCTTGTVTISNLSLASFGDNISSVMGHSPIFIGNANNKVVLNNVHICFINCEGIHVNGGTFEINNCNIDCSKTTESIYTKGICIVNAATGSITNTTITGVDCYDPNDLSAAIELQGSGDITISNCDLTSKTMGISATYVYVDGTPEHDQPGTSNVTVSGCTINADQYALYGNGYGKEGEGALITVTSGTYNGPLDAKAGTTRQGLSISGGTFDHAVPEEYCAPGFIPADQDPQTGLYSVKQGVYVAQIEEKNANNETVIVAKYENLKTAFTAVQDGQTIKMLADSDEAAEPVLAINGSVTLDLNGKTVTANDDIWVKTGSLTVVGSSGSTITSTGSAFYVSTQSIANNVATLTINSSDVNIHGDNYGTVVMSGGVVNLLAGNITSTNRAAISTNGTNTGSTINITSGTVTSTGSTAIYHPGPGTLNIGESSCLGEDNNHSHPVITGKTGIEMRAGTLNVYCGEITGNGDFAESANGSGSTITGAAVAISQHTTNLAINANIAGGTLSGPYGIYEKDLQNPTTGANVNIAVTGGDISGTTSAVAINDIAAESVNASISGGTFSSPVPMEYLADGFICPSTTNNDGRYYIEQGEYVAQIDNYGYETLEAAFAAVEDGQTITMLTDVTLTERMELDLAGKAVTLDLGGKTLTGRTNLQNGNLTIKNGTVAGGNQQALNVYGSATSGAQNYSVLNINSDVNVTADVYGVCLFGPTFNSKPGYGAVINIYGTVTTTGDEKNGAVFVSGNLGQNIDGDMKNVINVYGTITSATDAAIALNGNATVNVKDGATITGNTAIAIKRGTLNVEGGTVHATGLGNIPTAGNNNGTEMTGAAVSMTNTYNQYGAMQVNISGGSFTSDHAMALYKQEGTYTNDATYAVSGGIFNTPVPEEFCAEGYVPTSITTQGFTQYTVESGDFVAQIGETKYTTLAAAVAAVPTNGTETTITLLKDITLTNNVVVGGTFDGTNNSNAKKVTSVTNQNVILILDGHTITGEKTLYLAGGSLNITGTGSIISESPDVAPVGVRYVKTDDYPDLDYTSKRTLTIGKNVTLTGAQYGLNIFGTNEASKANSIDVTVDGTVNGMLFVLGNISNANNNINIDVNGTVDATNATGSEKVHTGIALCGNATVNVNDGATVSGESGIEVRAGNLTVNGGTITATSADYSYTANGSGTTTKGAAIAIAQHGTKAATSATILDGATLGGTKKIAVIDAQNNSLAGVTVIADDDFLTNSATETVLPDGYYWLSNGDGTSSPVSNSAVAQIGNTLYFTLADAVAAVPADGTPTTITLLQDITLTERLFVNAGATPAYAGTNNRYATTTENKNITLELDGHNIVSSSNIALAGGSLNITNNGTADATHGVISTTAGGLAPIEVRGTGDLTSKRTLTVGTGVTLSGAEYGLNIFGSNDQQKNIIDVNVNGTVKGMLFVLGNLKNADNEININVNGTVDASGVTGTGEAVHSGIALGGNATVNVNNGATVKGESGIEVRAGSLTVNGGTIEATVADYSYTANNNGMTTKGAAIAVAQHGTVRPIDVTINGGTLTGAKKIGVTDVNNNYLTDVSVVASNSFLMNAGTDTEIPAGFIWVDNGNNTKKLVLAPVRRNDVGYATLAEAIAAVENNDIIKLFADITLTNDIVCPQGTYTFMLGFNNHNVIQNGYHVMLPTGVSVLTDEQTQLFTAADEGYVVVESSTSNTNYPYEYTIVTAYFTENGITYHHANEGEEVSVGNTSKSLAVDINTTGNPVAVPQTVTHDNKTFTVTGVEQNAFSSDEITGIVLPATIADVENGAFTDADNLRYIDLSTATAFVPSTLQRNIAASPFNGVPKQTLIYLNGTTFQGENYVYKPGSGNQYFCEKFTIYDDLNGSQTGFDNKDYQWAFENPHQFTAYTIENTRMLSAGKHYTICLPYSIAIPAGTKAYTLDATSSQLFGFQEVTGTLAAFTPYVLIPTKSGQQLSATNTVVPAFEDDADGSESKLNGTTKGTFTLYGTMRYMDGDDAKDKYIMQYNNGNPTWKKITEASAGFEASNKACILPMRAYIINNTSGSREYMGFSFTNLDGSTTIYNIDDMMFDSEDAIYDLKGRKVQNVLHGPYIINGKKILVK